MGASSGSRSSRSAALLVVALLHGAVILLLLWPRAPGIPGSGDTPIEVVFLPPPPVPKDRPVSPRPRHLIADVSISVAPPSPTTDYSAAPAAAADGAGGPGVNWAAEAHRAVKAYEIRRDENVTHSSMGSTPWDTWPVQRAHHPGDRTRTENGDWVVWINDSCYQVAAWRKDSPAQDAEPPRTVCVDDRNKN
jgi:hypothetical protein